MAHAASPTGFVAKGVRFVVSESNDSCVSWAYEPFYPKQRLRLGNKEHQKYPYLLRGLQIEQPDQVWCSDIAYIRLHGGFVLLDGRDGLVQPIRVELGPFDYA